MSRITSILWKGYINIPKEDFDNSFDTCSQVWTGIDFYIHMIVQGLEFFLKFTYSY